MLAKKGEKNKQGILFSFLFWNGNRQTWLPKVMGFFPRFSSLSLESLQGALCKKFRGEVKRLTVLEEELLEGALAQLSVSY